ncbi:hypothetical protein HZ326_21194 [Fusarium oxysporum f. sp. albedinis]|nr:hypothetical protein HZ326_21194 [Fusarium oxysporum f. sp. albedinis]
MMPAMAPVLSWQEYQMRAARDIKMKCNTSARKMDFLLQQPTCGACVWSLLTTKDPMCWPCLNSDHNRKQPTNAIRSVTSSDWQDENRRLHRYYRGSKFGVKCVSDISVKRPNFSTLSISNKTVLMILVDGCPQYCKKLSYGALGQAQLGDGWNKASCEHGKHGRPQRYLIHCDTAFAYLFWRPADPETIRDVSSLPEPFGVKAPNSPLRLPSSVAFRIQNIF